MNIVHINAFDTGGGAAIACARHCEAMIQAGHNVTMLVVTKSSRLPFVKKVHQGLKKVLIDIWDFQTARTMAKINPTGTYSLMNHGFDFCKEECVRDADAIFLHWVNGNALTVEGVEKILMLGKPTFWYMHDMFPITGGCHHSLDCSGYENDCTSCPLIENKSYKSSSSAMLKSKLKRWTKYRNLSFVTPSNWLGECVRASKVAQNHNVYVVPNVLNTDVFKPMNLDAKSIFGLDHNKKTILFGAASIGSVYKGTQYAHDCLKILDPNNYEGLVIGAAPKALTNDIPLRIVETGFLNDSLSLSLAYNACDTFIISSMAENYPNVVLEAMACGKPCVGFRTGGIPDLIIDNETGYLTKEKTASDLALCVNNLFADVEKYNTLSSNCRRFVLEHNSYQNIMQIHKELYSIYNQ